MMKYLILLFITSNVFAGGFFALEKYNKLPESFRLYEFQAQCEKEESSPCYDIDACPLEECSLKSEVEFGYPTGKKILAFSNAKKAANDAAIEVAKNTKRAKEESKQAKISELKAINWDDVKTINDLKGIIKKHLETEE